MASQEANLPFIRNLASSDRKLRTASLETLRTFLTSRAPPRSTLTRTDALKLWKGLFYAMWMCDRPIPQQNLASELAELQLSSVAGHAGQREWMRAFWEVVGSEWTTGIDVLRMEKFLLLVRRVFGAGVRWVKAGWETDGDRQQEGEEEASGRKNKKRKTGKEQEKEKEGASRADVFLGVLAEWPLDKEGEFDRVPVGLRLHIVDIWVDELERAGVLADESEEAKAFVEGLGDAVRCLTKKFPSKPIRTRAEGSLADERLPWYKPPSQADEEDDVWQGFQD